MINGLIGLRPRFKDVVEVNPLILSKAWAYFVLDAVFYHGVWLSIIWDLTGEKYSKGKGFSIFVNGELRAHSSTLRNLRFAL